MYFKIPRAKYRQPRLIWLYLDKICFRVTESDDFFSANSACVCDSFNDQNLNFKTSLTSYPPKITNFYQTDVKIASNIKLTLEKMRAKKEKYMSEGRDNRNKNK